MHGARKVFLTDIAYAPYHGTSCYLFIYHPGDLHQAGPCLQGQRIAFLNLRIWNIIQCRNPHPQRPGIPLHKLPVHTDCKERTATTAHIQKHQLMGQCTAEEFFGRMKNKVDLYRSRNVLYYAGFSLN